YFSGGIIPDYLLEKELNLLDTPWSLILTRLIDPFNMIILRTFFSNIPESLEESAYLDGASYLTILTRIIIPLSTPVIATLSLFYAVSRWNGFQDALMYISSQEYYPIQMKLYQIIFTNMTNEVAVAEGSSAQMVPEGIKAAAVMVATVPILVVYPWLQRYFVTGVTLGAVKE
ncbi:MAG: putative aldouronate transport system permease protein, partial [Clostridiales bacterium]|nr:putative aldouronate transport system permease protein [Clostridiales bacterium]